jgi:hypothetical protein
MNDVCPTGLENIRAHASRSGRTAGAGRTAKAR